MSDKINFLSKTGYEKLVHELHILKTVDLPNVIVQITEAKEQGDLSENFEYHAAKEKQAFMQWRIDDIEKMLENVEIIEEKNSDGTIGYGSTVVFEIEWDKEYTAMLVGWAEVDVSWDNLSISFDSPIWAALAWKRVGETWVIRWLSSGRKNITVISIA